jgi:hypothetical protein
MGTVCPHTGEFFALEISHVDRDVSHIDRIVFQAFLDKAVCSVSPQRTHNMMILDNASWHKNSHFNAPFFINLPTHHKPLSPPAARWNDPAGQG